MKTTVVFPTYRNLHYTKRAHASAVLNAQRPEELEFLIVDNGSRDGTKKWAESLGIRYLYNPVTMNVARSWNMAMDATDSPLVLISNNDVEFTSGWDSLFESFDPAGQVGAALPIELKWDEPVPPDAPDKMVSCHAGGFCFALRREVYEKVGRFDEGFFCYEDTDWFHRLSRNFKLLQCGASKVRHMRGGTCVDLAQGVYDRAFMTSRFRFYDKHSFVETWGDSREMVSVVIPTHRRPELLDRALGSVFAQDVGNFRVYVIMDRPDEATLDTVKRRVDSDLRIAGFTLQNYGRRLKGVSDARNLGVEMAMGKYIAFLDDDDLWYPNHLRESMALHESRVLQMSYCNPHFAWRLYNSVTGTYHEVPDASPNISYDGVFDRERLEAGNYILTSSTMWWAPAIKGIPFKSGVDFEEDWDVFKRCPDPIAKLDKTTVRYTWTPGGAHLTGAKVEALR